MSNNTLECPQNSIIIISIGHVLQDLVVGQNFLICIVVHGALELNIGRRILHMALVISDGFNYMYLGWLIISCDPKCLTNKLLWIYDGESAYNTSVLLPIWQIINV